LNQRNEIVKICQNCRRENNDEAEVCSECETKFPVRNEPERLPPANQENPKFNDPISVSTKWLLWFVAWGFVAVVNILISPASILGALFFPIGLLVWLPNGEEKAIKGAMMNAWIFGWFFYILLSAVMLQIKKRGIFFIIYIIFCVLLMLNIVGCQRVMQAASEIH
jgi:hypothetical protein